jgi:tetratricopeptide (TPR) repeat protein
MVIRSGLGTLLTLAMLLARPAAACMWDSDTLEEEVKARPGLARAILEQEAPALSAGRIAELRARIARLKAAPSERDSAWWNELAAAHVRLGEYAEGARLLESVRDEFEDDYGVHANLGTAYHLMGRYTDAWREIAEGLRIDPEGHFGLERFHLALLYYLWQNAAYRERHLYVDDFSLAFAFPARDVPGMGFQGELVALRTIAFQLRSTREADRIAAKRAWIRATQILADGASGKRLGSHPKLDEGVLYVASLNRREPAAIVMLGVAALRKSDLNLAVLAFQRAIALDSPQRGQLRRWVDALEEHLSASGLALPKPPAR